MAYEDECRLRLDAAREYLEQARFAESPQSWRDWARRILEDIPGRAADQLRDEC